MADKKPTPSPEHDRAANDNKRMLASFEDLARRILEHDRAKAVATDYEMKNQRNLARIRAVASGDF